MKIELSDEYLEIIRQLEDMRRHGVSGELVIQFRGGKPAGWKRTRCGSFPRRPGPSGDEASG